jgi:serine phosphatase RsbU (regulator of sigma subunit)
MPGETESGDAYVVHPLPGGVLLAVVDGLGHGPAAAAAARDAISSLQAHAQEPLISLVKRCHEALRGTNGVVLTLATFDTGNNRLTWVGVGNVEGLLVHADLLARPAREGVLQRGGVVGYQLPPLQTSVLSVAPGDMLILATDGIRSRFADGLDLDRPPREIAGEILASHAKPSDDALVLVARFAGVAP